MKSFISQLRNKQGREFNDSVADVMRDRLGFLVKRRVRKIGHLLLGQLGDIDVLAADANKNRVIVVETKDLSVARTPSELSSEVTEFVYGYRGKRSVIAKHQDRVRWVHEHIGDVLAFLGLQTRKKWRVASYIVVDKALMTPHLRKCPVPVLTFEQLKRGLP